MFTVIVPLKIMTIERIHVVVGGKKSKNFACRTLNCQMQCVCVNDAAVWGEGRKG